MGPASGETEKIGRQWLGRAGKRWRPFLTVAAYQALRTTPGAPIPDDLRKVAVAIGSYAYDWPDQGTADPQTIEEALLSAHDSDTVPTFDPVSGNTTFDYAEEGTTHRVWMLDAASVSNQLKASRAMGVSVNDSPDPRCAVGG